MAIEFIDDGWFPTINFFKKKENWVDILEEAADNIADQIKDEAKRLAYSHFRQNTGALRNSIVVWSEVNNDKVSLGLESDHPAANLIEYGGYSPFPPWTEVGGELSYPQAKAVFKNQPFAEAHPFLRPALLNNIDELNSEIMYVAKNSV